MKFADARDSFIVSCYAVLDICNSSEKAGVVVVGHLLHGIGAAIVVSVAAYGSVLSENMQEVNTMSKGEDAQTCRHDSRGGETWEEQGNETRGNSRDAVN